MHPFPLFEGILQALQHPQLERISKRIQLLQYHAYQSTAHRLAVGGLAPTAFLVLQPRHAFGIETPDPGHTHNWAAIPTL